MGPMYGPLFAAATAAAARTRERLGAGVPASSNVACVSYAPRATPCSHERPAATAARLARGGGGSGGGVGSGGGASCGRGGAGGGWDSCGAAAAAQHNARAHTLGPLCTITMSQCIVCNTVTQRCDKML